MNDPLLQLICDALGLMNRAFVDPAKPALAMCEFYHQFRKLWDRGIPVGMGLGHLLVKPLDGAALGIHRLGEQGHADEALAAILFDSDLTRTDFQCTFVVSFELRKPRPGVTILEVDLAAGRVVVI